MLIEPSITLLEDIYSAGVTHDMSCDDRNIFIVQATGPRGQGYNTAKWTCFRCQTKVLFV
jgi:hypothetical protein